MLARVGFACAAAGAGNIVVSAAPAVARTVAAARLFQPFIIVIGRLHGPRRPTWKTAAWQPGWLSSGDTRPGHPALNVYPPSERHASCNAVQIRHWHLIPPRLNLDLFQVGVVGEAANAPGGERIPCLAEGIDDGLVGVEQAM